MKTKLHPRMQALLEEIFPDRTSQESLEEICKHGQECFDDITTIKNKKDADSSPAP